MIKHISIPPFLSGRSLRLVSTDESLCEMLPSNENAMGEFAVKVSPYAAGTQVCRLQAIDEATGELAAAWALRVDGKIPEVAQGHFLYVPPGKINKRDVAFRNPLNYDATYTIRTSAPILVQPLSRKVRVLAGADQVVSLAICSDLNTLALFGSNQDLTTAGGNVNVTFQSYLAGNKTNPMAMSAGGALSKFDSQYTNAFMDESAIGSSGNSFGNGALMGAKSLLTIDAFMFIESEHGEINDVHMLKIFVTRQV
eukprot:GDKJ01051474.1.p1 GENE.GDKJ01051474.1~~GDKJ01051474.1.p1  ORF type:complete len:254 (+),score=41.79 GDKJ01051474.1:3-764(+)